MDVNLAQARHKPNFAVGHLSGPQDAIGGGHSGVFAFQAAPAPSDATEHEQRLGLR